MKIQLVVFAVVAVVAGAVMVFGVAHLPGALLGVGRYTVTVELPESGGLYTDSNVTYRGTQVGRVTAVRLTETGVEAVLSLSDAVPIPADLDAEVHSQSAVGEQFVALIPRAGAGRPLQGGDVIPRERTSVPPDIDELLDATNTGLEAIPAAELQTVIEQAYVAVGGLGPEIRRFVMGSTQLAIDGRGDLDALVTLIDDSAPVLNSQTETADAIATWADDLADVADSLRDSDAAVAGVLERGPQSVQEGRALLDRLRPTLPVIAANLASVGEVAVVYQPAIEQLLVLLPQGVASTQAMLMANLNTRQDYKGSYLDFNLNLGLPPPCTTGFLPAQQRRAPAMVDYPDRPDGNLYCRVPQDSQFNVRGVRNNPCLSVPGKRAPTVAMCESDEQYVPINDGMNWKGDPNATLSGQEIPELPAETVAPEHIPPIAVAEYDPATGGYVAPDGRVYTQADLAADTAPDWRSMLLAPGG
ncbi:MAG: MlaD family protein [Actinomycetota bacterium]|nr:MlaD family protein [Actinomycetota bacterium]